MQHIDYIDTVNSYIGTHKKEAAQWPSHIKNFNAVSLHFQETPHCGGKPASTRQGPPTQL